jgi:hypothetical protein
MNIEDRMTLWAAKRPREEPAELLLEGAQEIADLRRQRDEKSTHCPHVVGTTTQYCSLTPLTLTAAEREAVEVAAAAYASDHGERFAATLRNLLERTK